MPCTINSSTARASRGYRQAMGKRTTGGENGARELMGKRDSREEI
jgi:hypothetical protein